MPAGPHRKLLLFNKNSKGFNPVSIPGLQLWLDATNMGAFNDGDPVGTWPDRSGNGNDATQVTTANKPIYKVSGINGKPAILLDGVGAYWSSNNLVALASGTNAPFSVVFVVAPLNVAANYAFLSIASSASATVNFFQLRFNVTTGKVFVQIADNTPVSASATSTPTPSTAGHVIILTFSGTAINVYVDGVSYISNFLTGTGSFQPNQYTLGAYRRTGLQDFFKGYIGIHYFYSKELNASEINYLQSGLKARWGTP